MKREFLAELGLEKDIIDKIMKDNGDDIETIKSLKADVTNLQAKLEEKEKAITELNENIKSFEGTDETIKALQDKVAGYEKAESERKKAEKDAEADKILTNNILEVIGSKEFVNDFTKDSIIAQVKAELGKAENKGKGASEIFDALTKDSTDIFKNPQQQKLEIPPTGQNNANNDDDAFVRQVMGLPPKK